MMLSDIALKTMEYVVEFWELKNHPNTGAFVDSLRYETKEEDDVYTISIYGLEYGHYMNKGITANKVKGFYSPPTGRGGTSSYIQGLKSWVETKLSINPNESLGIAFAIANTHWNEGITSQGNPYTRGEGGTGWLDQMREEREGEISDMIREYIKSNLFK